MFVALCIQHAMRMRNIVIRGPYGYTIFFPHYLTNGTIFGGGGEKLLNIKCVFWFTLQMVHETFLILRRLRRNIINVHRSSCKVPAVLLDLHEALIFATDFGKIFKCEISRKSVLWGAEFSHADRETDGRTDRRAGRQAWRSSRNFSPLTH